ncbi:MAG: hypothetical protein MK132_15770 [Lentisphaerales bacterium]|nr:hypothetical protein [Lentisphaerales bacterium]
MKIIINSLASIVLIGLTAFIYSKISVKPEKPKVKVKQLGISVKSIISSKTSSTVNMNLWGEVRYRRHIYLKSEVEGRVLKMNSKLRPGYNIQKGEVLVEIDSERILQKKAELSATLLANRAELSQLEVEETTLKSEIKLAAANVALAQEDVERHERLVENSNASKLTLSTFKQQLIRAQATHQQLLSRLKLIPQRQEVSKARIKSIEAAVSLVEKDLKDSLVKAPFSARIIGQVVSEGDYLRKGELVCELVDPLWYEVWVNIGVTEQATLGSITSVELNGQEYKDFRFLGELEKNIQADYLIFEVKGQKLKAGELISLEVKGQELDEISILPESALRNDRQSVYLVVDGKLKITPVEVILVDQGKVYISKGLPAGSEVITTRLNDLPEGTLVNSSKEK